MKQTESYTEKEKAVYKKLPLKIRQGKSMIDKFNHAKLVSASIKGFAVTK